MRRRNSHGAVPEPHANPTARLEAFSDAVFAVAITLLALDIHTPHVEHGLLHALLMQWPVYISYALSFGVIGVTWAAHHNMLSYFRRTSHVLLALNTLLLLNVVTIPFTASVLAAYIGKAPAEERVAAMLYSGTLVVGGGFYNAIWWYGRRQKLLDLHLSAERLRRITRRFAVGPLLYGVAFLLATVSVKASLGMFVLLIVLYVFPGSDENDERRDG